MIHFFADLPRYTFLQYAVIAAVLAAMASGVAGSLIVVRRSTYISGAISHCVLGGLGAARYCQVVYGIEWLTPMIGALVAALVAALIVAWATVRARERLDSVLSIVWALGMSVGITFIVKTPGYGQDLMSYLFGSILMVSSGDLLLMAVLDLVIVVTVVLFYNRIFLVSFHEESARVQGIAVGLYITLLSVLSALTIVLLTRIVGVVLVIALLSIPAATAARLTKRLGAMMGVAVAVSLCVTLGGLVVSYGTGLPTGATIIQIAVAVYGAVIGAGALRRRMVRTRVP